MFIREKPIFSSERMLHKGYYLKGSVKKILWSCVSRDGLIGGKPPVSK
jgi:hypothetical protein